MRKKNERVPDLSALAVLLCIFALGAAVALGDYPLAGVCAFMAFFFFILSTDWRKR